MKIHALIVDDEECSIRTLQKNISWESYGISQVYTAESAMEAREIMGRTHIDLLLCDIEMPKESGLELIEWIREEKQLEDYHIECIILTCYAEYPLMRKAMQLGCSDYLLKPLDYGELADVLKKTVALIREAGQTRQMVEEDTLPGQPRDLDFVHEKMLPYIQENLTSSFSVGDLAQAVALNPQYAMRLFKKTMGLSILEYVTGCRMELAGRLLTETDYNNEIIAGKVGYVSANYFIRLFKKHFGITPREYRRQHKKAIFG